MKRIRSLDDLCGFWCADEPRGLNRRVYKATDCGASISLLLRDGSWLHNGAQKSRALVEIATDQWEPTAKNWIETWAIHCDGSPISWGTVQPIDVVGFTIQTIVEGSDATVDSETFMFPVSTKKIDEWVRYMEAEASLLWDEANVEEDEGTDD